MKINKNTVIDWNNYLREVCVLSTETRNQEKIEGRGKIVEIDETKAYFSNAKIMQVEYFRNNGFLKDYIVNLMFFSPGS